MRLRHPIAALVAIACLDAQITAAQAFEVGVKGGVRTSDDLSGTLTPESKRYIVGPMLEVRLPLRLSLEFDALYQRVGFTGYYNSCCGSSITRERDNSWEFPMIAKYHVPVGKLHPYAGIGYSPRIVHGIAVSSGTELVSSAGITPFFGRSFNTSYPVMNGVVVSAGLDLRALHTRFTPEFRYEYWTSRFLDVADFFGRQYVSNQNDFFVLLGISWP